MTRATEDKTLVLMRHAKAEQTPGKPDHDRSLTDKGRQDAMAAGRWLHEHGIVAELVICSTAIRTRETWDHAAKGGAHTEFVEYRRAVYQGNAESVLDSVHEDAGEVDTVIVVGHAPAIPALASMLCDGEGSQEAHQALAEGYPTCGLAVLRFNGEWQDLDHGDAALERFHVARG
jgi:phosphohistidine phosphatase